MQRSADAFAQLVQAVPFYAGITLEAIGGEGLRWPEAEGAAHFPAGEGHAERQVATPASTAPALSNGHLRLGRYRPLWASPEVEISPALQYLIAGQHLELSPEDAIRLGINHGDAVQVAQNGTRVQATAAVRSGVPAGSAFLAEGLAADSANTLTEPLIEVIK